MGNGLFRRVVKINSKALTVIFTVQICGKVSWANFEAAARREVKIIPSRSISAILILKTVSTVVRRERVCCLKISERNSAVDLIGETNGVGRSLMVG